jgi:hypothetical protein
VHQVTAIVDGLVIVLCVCCTPAMVGVGVRSHVGFSTAFGCNRCPVIDGVYLWVSMSCSALAVWDELEAMARAKCSSPLTYWRMETSSPRHPGRTCGGMTEVVRPVALAATVVCWMLEL